VQIETENAKTVFDLAYFLTCE